MTSGSQGLPSDDLRLREPRPVRMAGRLAISSERARGPDPELVEVLAGFIVLGAPLRAAHERGGRARRRHRGPCEMRLTMGTRVAKCRVGMSTEPFERIQY